jgi:hypothetical protein
MGAALGATLGLMAMEYANQAQATNDMADYIVSIYNRQRLHPNWATCRPMPLSSNRQSNNLSACVK